MEVTRSVTGPAVVLPALLTDADVVVTDEKITTDVVGWLDEDNEELLAREDETVKVDVGSDVVKTEGEVSENDVDGPAEETTDAEPELKGLEVKTPSMS